MIKTFAIISTIVVLTGCGETELSAKQKQDLWVEVGKDAVLQKLKDGESAKFQNVYFNKSAKGVPVTCGEVTSKNSFGAYTGYQKFISAGKPELTFLQEEVEDFHTSWNSFCV
jgi:hypothetical protein